jgi:DNA mismatch repair ATPase MutS
MAELSRIKQIVDAARQTAHTDQACTMYLLDDVLHGTNTTERQLAVRRVLDALLEAGAIGVVTTHDLALASSAELAAACRPVHFRETFEIGPDGPVLSFDYLLRPGLASSTNALKLMEIVGLGDNQ